MLGPYPEVRGSFRALLLDPFHDASWLFTSFRHHHLQAWFSSVCLRRLWRGGCNSTFLFNVGISFHCTSFFAYRLSPSLIVHSFSVAPIGGQSFPSFLPVYVDNGFLFMTWLFFVQVWAKKGGCGVVAGSLHCLWLPLGHSAIFDLNCVNFIPILALP